MEQPLITKVDEIKTVAVLGAGTMGHGIAQVAAMNGYRVVMRDVRDDLLVAAVGKITQNLDKGVAKAKVTPKQRASALALLRTTTDMGDACSDAQLVIEAVPESLDIKAEIFGAASQSAPSEAIFASNTSSLSIADIAATIRQPGRVIGMHFFNPVHIMKLVEIIKHDGCYDAVVACAGQFAQSLGKTAITVKDTPGFASSRLGLVLGLEAMRMFEQNVASADDIDTAMKLGYGHPMGPLELTDLVGLDIRLHIAEYLTETVSVSFTPPTVLRELVAEGNLGKKTGRGFYQWENGKRVR